VWPGQSECPLVSVRLPPLPARPPTPPPRPEASLVGPAQPTQPSIQLPSPLTSLDTPITLTSPRSASTRAQNLYVDTPFKVSGPSETRSYQSRSRPLVKTHSSVSAVTNSVSVITSPPPSHHTPHKPGLNSPPSSDSIICVSCGRCRCAACASPKPLPSHWLCNNSCLCSAESVVDTISCMCCVKAAFYHCGEKLDQDTDKEDSWVDSPCSCSSNKWWQRWTCLTVLCLPLPCLLCYPLLRGVTRAAEYCYQLATSQGCRCPQQSSLTSPKDSHKRLLG